MNKLGVPCQNCKFCNIYFVGDGYGKAGNIVTAAATGLVAARGIIKSISNWKYFFII